MNELSPCCHAKAYRLSDGMKKCVKCRRKFSPKKIQKYRTVIKAFIANQSALEASKQIGISYPTARKRYEQLRLMIANHLENLYEKHREDPKEFEEYIYLEASKRQKKHAVFDAHNFISFDYEDGIYNLMMPSLQRFKQAFVDDGLSELYFEQFARFIRRHKIAKLDKKENRITAFWEFFESFIVRYKGVKPESFVYYLKEAEFKYNFSPVEQERILLELWFGNHV